MNIDRSVLIDAGYVCLTWVVSTGSQGSQRPTLMVSCWNISLWSLSEEEERQENRDFKMYFEWKKGTGVGEIWFLLF